MIIFIYKISFSFIKPPLVFSQIPLHCPCRMKLAFLDLHSLHYSVPPLLPFSFFLLHLLLPRPLLLQAHFVPILVSFSLSFLDFPSFLLRPSLGSPSHTLL